MVWSGGHFFSETVKRLPRLMSERKRKASDVTTVVSLKKKKSTVPATGVKRKGSSVEKNAKRAATARPVEHTHTEKPTAAAPAEPPSQPSAGTVKGRPTQERVVAILQQEGAEAALKYLRGSMKSYNAKSFCSQVYQIRTLFYERVGPPAGYESALAVLQAAVDASGVTDEPVNSFLMRNYREQRAYAKALCRSNQIVSSDAVVRAAYKQICANVEHKALEKFVPTPEQTKHKHQETEQAKQRKASTNRKVVPNGDKLVSWCVDLFQSINKGEEFPEDTVCVALLLTTGRRTSEIRMGLSTFKQEGENPYHVRFEGQIKTTNKGSFCFQALLPITLWIGAYTKYFQEKYSERSRELKMLNRDSELPDTAASERLKRMIRLELKHESLTAHDLRAIYARVAYIRFEHTDSASFNTFARVQLGHKFMEEATAYDHVHVDGLVVRMPASRIEVDYTNGSGCANDKPPPINTSYDPAF